MFKPWLGHFKDFIIFVNQQPFYIAQYKNSKIIYQNYTNCFYKSNFNIYFQFLFKSNKREIILECFFKGVHIYNK
jgi:hypothetical protein